MDCEEEEPGEREDRRKQLLKSLKFPENTFNCHKKVFYAKTLLKGDL